MTRSAGSHGSFDLIAVKPPQKNGYFIDFGEIRLIQLKTGKSKKRAIVTVSLGGIKEAYEGLYRVSVDIE